MARRKSENRIIGIFKTIGRRRIAFALLFAIVGGLLSFMLAVSGVARTKAPHVALAMIPGESMALSMRADQMFFANANDPSPRLANFAKAAVEQQALNPQAVRLLGYMADAKGERDRALTLITMAARLSRREQGAQLWLIEYNAQADDTKKTLEHYDTVLMTKPASQAMLFPRLSNAIEDAPIRTALLPYIRGNRSWVSAFLSHAIANDKSASNLVELITEAGGLPKSDAAPTQYKSLLSRLVNNGRFDDAVRIYKLVPGAQPDRLVDPSFTAADREGRFGAMDWTITDDPNAGGGFSIGKGTKKVELSIFANAATTQVVASRLLYLKPGSHRFSATLSQLDRGDGGYVLFRMRCPAGDSSSLIWSLNVSVKQNDAPLNVPTQCPVQFLEIFATGGKGQLGLEAAITAVSISQ
jgi:tetratricopeptide (TPR) repeat protein